jgi:hypothetical protein
LQKKVFPMVECRLGNGRPLIEKGRLRLVSVPSNPPKPYFEWQAGWPDRAGDIIVG